MVSIDHCCILPMSPYHDAKGMVNDLTQALNEVEITSVDMSLWATHGQAWQTYFVQVRTASGGYICKN